jgi:hypothetical protein
VVSVDDLFVVGQVVPLTFEVTDKYGYPANATTAVVTVTLLGGSSSTPTVANPQTGQYTVDYIPATAGRYVATFVTTGTNAGMVVDAFDVQATNLGLVALADATAYLGDTSYSNADIQSALDAERAAQAKVCRIDNYGLDLKEALLRRVARNLAARSVPIATFNSFEGGGSSSRVPMKDPEIARLEAPYRRLVVG